MKLILASIVLAATGLLFSGCETDVSPDHNRPNAAERFHRGMRGEGQITQPDRSGDPLIRENTRVGY